MSAPTPSLVSRAAALPRSYLFVPGDRPERFAKALAAGADAVILDLEDAVAAARKCEARGHVSRWLDALPATPRPELHVRINDAASEWFADDVAAVASHPAVRGVVLPKAQDAGTLAGVRAGAHSGLALLPLLESAVGFARIDAIAASPGVLRLLFGTVDFQVDLGIGGDGDELSYFRSMMVLASRVAGIAAPVDGVTTSIDDTAAVEGAAREARRRGMRAKLCIHPRQVEATHRGFAPTEDERAWARRVVQAARDAEGAAVALDGRMIDLPVLRHAEDVLRACSDGLPG